MSQVQAIPSYAAYRRLRELVVDKKYFTMSRVSYGEVLDQPGQTFFSGESNIMATEFLKQVELRPETGDQTIRLVYHEGETVAGAFTLYDYLDLVLFIAKVLNVESGDDAVTFTREDLERYPALAVFRREVRSLFRTNVATEGLQKETFEEELLTEAFFFNGTKSVVTLEESRRQPDEYNLLADVSLTVTITSLRDTPEEDIVQAIGRSNGVYLMSATGGLSGVSSGAFNVGQLQRVLQANGGHFSDMTDAELEVVSAKAIELIARRERQVTILNDDDPAIGFEVSTGYKGLRHEFHMALPQREDPGYGYLNTYKRHEIDGLVASLDVLLSTDVRSGLVLCQTVGWVRTALMNLARGGTSGIDQVDRDGHVFRINPRHLPRYRSAQDHVTLVLYTAERFRSRDETKTGAVQEADDDGQFNEELVKALDITNKKVLLWTAYGSASRGMNFITKQHGKECDFELFCLLNDPYYTRHTRPRKHGFTMETFQSYLQVLRDEGDAWGGMTKRDLLFEYSRNRWKRLRKEHYVDITRKIFQALGRGERRPDEGMPRQRVYLSAHAAHMVHLGTRYAPELVRRASPAQRAALAAIEEHNRMAALFTSGEERRVHEQESLKRAISFRQFTSETPRLFRSSERARTTWLALFDTRMFTHPTEYIDALKKRGAPAEFTDGAYFMAPVSSDLYTKEVSIAGISELILTDAFDGADVYDWVAMLAPVGLAERLSPQTRRLLKLRYGFRFDTPDGPMKFWPQPWFVSEIMKGYIAEAEFERFIEKQFRVVPAQMDSAGRPLRYVDPAEHPLAAELFQLFDFYLEVPGSETFVAVDMKNWARSTDRLKKEALQEEAAGKYERLRALLPDRWVKAVYVNLYGAHRFLVNKNVHFRSLYVQTRRNGVDGWMVNENLLNVLLGP